VKDYDETFSLVVKPTTVSIVLLWMPFMANTLRVVGRSYRHLKLKMDRRQRIRPNKAGFLQRIGN
jgi:hypothetical protein